MTEDIAKKKRTILQELGSGTPDGVWIGVNMALDFQLSQDTTNALAPGLNGDSRHYNAGRAAALDDLKAFIRDLYAQARPLAGRTAPSAKSPPASSG